MSQIFRFSGKLYFPTSTAASEAIVHQIFGTCKDCQLLRNGMSRYSTSRMAASKQKQETMSETRKQQQQQNKQCELKDEDSRLLKEQDSHVQYKYYSELSKTINAQLLSRTGQLSDSLVKHAIDQHGDQHQLSDSLVKHAIDQHGDTHSEQSNLAFSRNTLPHSAVSTHTEKSDQRQHKQTQPCESELDRVDKHHSKNIPAKGEKEKSKGEKEKRKGEKEKGKKTKGSQKDPHSDKKKKSEKQMTSKDLLDKKNRQENEQTADAEKIDILGEVFQSKVEKVIEEAKGKKYKWKDKKSQEDVTKMWQTVFNIEFKSYVQACAYAGEINFAIEGLNYYRGLMGDRKERFQVRDIEIYHDIIACLAELGDITTVKKIFQIMKEDGINPSLRTYALCLLCAEKSGDSNLIQRFIDSIGNQGLDVRNILVDSRLNSRQSDTVIKMLQSVIPDFVPLSKDHIEYKGVLTDDLYKPVQHVDKVGNVNPYAGVMTHEEVMKKVDRQIHREKMMYIHVKAVDRQRRHTKAKKELLAKYKEFWKEALTAGFEIKLTALRHKRFVHSGINIYPFLKIFSADHYVRLMTREVDYLCAGSGYSPKMPSLHFELGDKLNRMLRLKGKDVRKQMKIYNSYTHMTLDPKLSDVNHRKCWNKVVKRKGEYKTGLQVVDWSPFIKMMIGRELYDIILKCVLVDAKAPRKWIDFEEWKAPVPAFSLATKTSSSHFATKQIQPHPVVTRLWGGQMDLVFKTTELPMIVPPVPWTSSDDAGYLLYTDNVVRRPSTKQRQLLQTASMEPVLDSINILSNCAWVVNKPVLDVVIKVFNSGGDANLEIRRHPKSVEKPVYPKRTSEQTYAQRLGYFKERARYRKEVNETTSMWYSDLYKYSIANMFRDVVFWLPHNLDFRGRTYPIPPHFNHQTADVTRALLKFARGKPLGEKGLDWLKLHCINLTGFKKRTSNEDRIQFANENLELILDSAERPLTGDKWWMESDEPLQTLACCMEIRDAVGSGDPVNFISQLPVHQDGSCNGLQHYAALGRDEIGAKSVNLYPFDKPNDVYSDVVELVEGKRKRDQEHSTGDKENQLAEMLEGYITRKVIKQTIMTTVYGVTPYGAQLQIGRQLKDLNFSEEYLIRARKYLAAQTFSCIQQMFTSAKLIQDWFTLCSNGISRKCNVPVEWVTPLNFPVVQGYHKFSKLKNSSHRITDLWTDTLPPNHMKQVNAFAPNFVHSLDSTHMMLTSLYCLRKGVLFMSVHDCFWTHACDVPTMNRITREQFLALHSLPILEDLSEFFQRNFCDIPPDEHYSKQAVVEELRRTIQQVPPRGDFDLNNVLKSTYFFS